MPDRRIWHLWVAGALGVPGALLAQEGRGGIAGQLVDRATGAPVSGAQVFVLGQGGPDRSDAEGRFRRTGLKAGYYVVEVRSVGYARTSWEIQVPGDEVVTHVLELEPLATLSPVIVEGERPTWYREFEERRASRRGQFMTREDIERRAATSLGELLRSLNGFRLNCNRNRTECTIRMTRWVSCIPLYYQDGIPIPHEAAERFLPLDIYGIEVYHVSEVPLEFQRADLRCGVVVVWTRRGPPPR